MLLFACSLILKFLTDFFTNKKVDKLSQYNLMWVLIVVNCVTMYIYKIVQNFSFLSEVHASMDRLPANGNVSRSVNIC